jgi:hypothetical protein
VRQIFPLLLALALLPTQGALGKDRDRGKDDARRAEPAAEPQAKARRGSRGQAVERARREGGGRVLSIQERPGGGGNGYRAKILTPDGVVRYLDLRP